MRQTVLVCCSVVKMAGLLQALADAVLAPFAAQPAEELTPTTPTSKIKAEEVRFGHLSLLLFMLRRLLLLLLTGGSRGCAAPGLAAATRCRVVLPT